VTANLWSTGAEPAALGRLLESLRPDVLAVQELGPDQAEVIADLLPYGALEPRRDYDGMGIALRRPGEVERLALPKRDARLARISPEAWPGLGAPVEVVNVHVLAPHALPPWRTAATRLGQVRGLARWLDANPHPARFVCGDLNATPGWPAYRRLAERLRDLARDHAAASGARAPGTWGPGARGPRLLRIDHVFASSGRTLDARTVRIEGSDHDAVLVDVEV
jgi:endonuclease/exonuclease/phosphatase family metal-dependent hydrolase